MVASSILAGGAYKNKDLDESLVPPVIENGLVPCNGEESAAKQGNATAEIAATAVAPVRVPAHRVQLARALADAVVGALEAGDAEGAKVAVGMLAEFIARMVENK